MWHYNIKGSKQAVQFVYEIIFIRQIETRQIKWRQIKIRQNVLRHEHDDLIRLFKFNSKKIFHQDKLKWDKLKRDKLNHDKLNQDKLNQDISVLC